MENNNKAIVTRNINKYKVPDANFHILHRSSVYIGNSKPQKQKVYIARISEEGTIIIETIALLLSEGVERVFLETLANAVDALKEALAQNYVEERPIIIKVTNKRVTIRNGGIVIQNKKHKQYKDEYVASVLFGIVFASSNYGENINSNEKESAVNTDAIVIGRNGWGSKIANIFSLEYNLENADGSKLLKQTWKENMTIKEEPEITESEEHYVQVSYLLDFGRFDIKSYDEDTRSLFRSHCYDMAYSTNLCFKFNGLLITPMNIYQYAKLQFPDATKIVVCYLWNSDDKYKLKETEYGPVQISKTGRKPILEIAYIDTVQKARFISFINGLIAREGGTHIDAAYKAIGNIILPEINTMESKKLNVSSVKKHMSIIVSYNINGIPQTTSNMKTKLQYPKFEVSLNQKQKREIMEFSVIEALRRELDSAIIKDLGPTIKNSLRVHVDKLIDANFASVKRNKRDGNPVYLVLTEGDSAANFINLYYQKDRDHYGILPLRGKIKNVSKCKDIEQLFKNKEYIAIITALGLRENIDYSDDENFANTRYDGVLIATDMDEDGAHIKGLLTNIFRARHLGLTERPEYCIRTLQTALRAVKIGNKRIIFFHPREYEEWRENNPRHANIIPKYYKGLGAFVKSEIIEDAKNDSNKMVPIVYDENADAALHLAFGAKNSNARKEWILAYNDQEWSRVGEELTVSDLVNNHVVRYAVESTRRTMAGMDGQKESTRKVLSACTMRWTTRLDTLIRVDSFGGYITEHMQYHHGEASLYQTIARMTCCFAGMNNMNILVPEGMFADRNGFKSAQPRYVSTRPQDWFYHMFKRIDLEITPKNNVDSREAEYSYIPQVLPILLINGTRAICEGWNSYIPGARPKLVARYYKQKLLGEEPKMFRPWFVNFIGSVRVVETDKLKKEEREENIEERGTDEEETNSPEVSEIIDDDIIIEPPVQGNNTAKYTIVVTGKYTVEGDTVTITEIPIGITINNYYEYLKKLCADGIISSISNYTEDENPHFVLYGVKNPTEKLLRLRTITKLSNLNILEQETKLPRHFDTIQEIAEVWYDWNLPHYVSRRTYLLKKYKKQIETLRYKSKYIELVNTGRLIISDRSKTEIMTDLDSHNIPYEEIKGILVWQLTTEKVEELKGQIEILQQDHDKIELKTPEQLWLDDIEELEPYLI